MYIYLCMYNYIHICAYISGLPWWFSNREPACQCRRCRFDPWIRKTPWRRKWQHILVFLPGKSHAQRSREGYSPWSSKESDTLRYWAHTQGHMYLCSHKWCDTVLTSFPQLMSDPGRCEPNRLTSVFAQSCLFCFQIKFALSDYQLLISFVQQSSRFPSQPFPESHFH